MSSNKIFNEGITAQEFEALYSEFETFLKAKMDEDYRLISIQDSKNMAVIYDDPILVKISLSETMLIPIADLYPETRKQNG